MIQDLMKNKIVYEAILEYDELREAKEKISHRNKCIQKNVKINQTVKSVIQEKSARMLQLISILLEHPELTLTERELLFRAASTYNYQICILLNKSKKCLRFLYKGFCKDNYSIAEALGYRMTGVSYLARHLEITLAVMISFIILFDIAMILVGFLTEIWTPYLLAGGAITLVIGGFLYPLLKNKRLVAVAESCRARFSQVDINQHKEFEKELGDGLEQVEAVKNIFTAF